MKIISHRGNIKGRVPDKENRPSYIDCAIMTGLEVEVDVRFISGSFYLGHDTPDYIITPEWINHRIDNIWFHCKNIEAAYEFKKIDGVKYFCHTQDSYILTSTCHLWVHDLTLPLTENCIIPLLTQHEVEEYRGGIVYGVCTDYVDYCKFDLNQKGLYLDK